MSPSPLLVSALMAAFTPILAAQGHDSAQRTVLSARLGAMAAEAPIAVAHRGASRDYPENTLPAFRAAVEAGASVVELDFRQTSDGALVVLHDETLDRTTDCRALWKKKGVRVDATPVEEIAKLDAGSWKDERFAGTRVPTLEQSLDVIQKGSITMIEHKAGGADELVALLRRMELVDTVLVQSFDWEWLRAVHRLEPRLTIAALGGDPLDRDALAGLPRTGAAMAHWNGKRLTTADLGTLHDRGYLVCGYTLNSDLELLGAAALGLDLITTDRPERLLSLIAEGRASRPEQKR